MTNISYVGLVNTSVWHKGCCYLTRVNCHLIRMTQLQILSHTDDLLTDQYGITIVTISYELLSYLYDISAIAIWYGWFGYSSVWHMYIVVPYAWLINTLRPRQNGRHLADHMFKCIFLNENVWISINISLKVVSMGLIDNIPALVQIMAWRRSGDKSLSEPMMDSLLTHICVTRPQWVKSPVWHNNSIPMLYGGVNKSFVWDSKCV